MRAILRPDEPEDVYRELVDGMAANAIPMLIFCVALVSTGAYVLSFGASSLVLIATALSAAVSLVKIVLILYHERHRADYRRAPIAAVRRIEAMHAVSTISVGLSIGFYSVSIFGVPQDALHMIPVSITYGYSAGLIARVSIRPRIAYGTILSIGLPSAAAVAVSGDEHVVVAAIYLVFIVAGLQSIDFVYRTTRQAVTLRLQIEALARHDPLTGLLNRLGLQEAFKDLPRSEVQPVTVHAFDLDGFKSVNDTFGHAAGDRLLKILAERIRAIVPPGTIMARTGGDEFVLIQLGEGDAARQLAERIHHQLALPCEIDPGRQVEVGLSLGCASGRLSHIALEDLTKQADALSYAAKRSGGGIRANIDGGGGNASKLRLAASG